MSFFTWKKGVKDAANASVALSKRYYQHFRCVEKCKFRFWTRFGIFNVTADKYIQYIWLHANHLKIVALEYKWMCECNVSDGS